MLGVHRLLVVLSLLAMLMLLWAILEMYQRCPVNYRKLRTK